MARKQRSSSGFAAGAFAIIFTSVVGNEGLSMSLHHTPPAAPKPKPFAPTEPQSGRASSRSKGNPNREIATHASPAIHFQALRSQARTWALQRIHHADLFRRSGL